MSDTPRPALEEIMKLTAAPESEMHNALNQIAVIAKGVLRDQIVRCGHCGEEELNPIHVYHAHPEAHHFEAENALAESRPSAEAPPPKSEGNSKDFPAHLRPDRRKHNNPCYKNAATGCLVCAPNSVERRKVSDMTTFANTQGAEGAAVQPPAPSDLIERIRQEEPTILSSRNKWRILCERLGHNPETTPVATVLDPLAAQAAEITRLRSLHEATMDLMNALSDTRLFKREVVAAKKRVNEILNELCKPGSTPPSAWISVKERLPEKEGDYMVWCDGSYPAANGKGVFAPFYFFKIHGKFREDVTHWRAIPAPPSPPSTEPAI